MKVLGPPDPEPPELVPDGCTCLWSMWIDPKDNKPHGSVYISMPDCPAKPHPRSY